MNIDNVCIIITTIFMVIYFSIAIYEKYVELKEETKAYVSNNRVKIIIDELSNFNENS